MNAQHITDKFLGQLHRQFNLTATKTTISRNIYELTGSKNAIFYIKVRAGGHPITWGITLNKIEELKKHSNWYVILLYSSFDNSYILSAKDIEYYSQYWPVAQGEYKVNPGNISRHNPFQTMDNLFKQIKGDKRPKRRMIFFNTGWMRDYKGIKNDKIVGGGEHVRKYGYGHEIFNFLPYRRQNYGYIQVGGEIELIRLGALPTDEFIDNVTVVWTARNPSTGGTYIIGWYNEAKVYRDRQSPPKNSNRKYRNELFGYYATAKTKDTHLLTLDERVLQIPRGKNGMGQRNIWYSDNNPEFIQKVFKYIDRGAVPSTHKVPPRKNGTPRQTDPLKRQKVEKTAVVIVIRHYKKKGFEVYSVEKDNVGWDLEAIKVDVELKIEVKGLSQNFVSVELTPNEYKNLKKLKDNYRLCVVTETLTNPDLSIFSYSTEHDQWIDEKGRVLKIEEIKSARMKI